MHDFYKEYVSSGQAGAVGPTLAGHVAARRPYFARVIREGTAGLDHPRILDAACGSGKLVSLLRELEFQHVIGVDISSEQIQLGTEFGVAGLICADVLVYLEQTDEQSIDVVFAIDFLEHLTVPEALRFIGAVRRALTAQGRLVMHVPNAQSPFSNAIRYGDITHTRAFTRRSLDQLLFPSSMRVARFIEDTPPVHGVLSLARLVVWTVWRSLLSFAWMAETGELPDALSRNVLVIAQVVRESP